MSKAVLISIQPQWCKLIADGKKKMEVRKTKPNLETPFKVYIYCTNKEVLAQSSMEGWYFTASRNSEKELALCGSKILNGKVIGEFVCDTFVTDRTFGHDPLFNGAACMSEVDAAVYSCQSPIYGWHISDHLVVYGKPKSLSEFQITRPPRSWCYVKEREENA